ncbi:MAG: hypothetical protein ACTS5V_06110 [Giesbergeria sp.]
MAIIQVSTEIVHEGMGQWWMDFGNSFELTEESIAWLLATKKGKNDPEDAANAPCSTEGAPNEQARFNPDSPP